MGNEIINYDESGVPAFADDTLLAIAKMAEARIDAVIKIKQLALKVTNGFDWTDQGGKPYLQASGAEKIANLFNISWGFLTPEPLYEQDDDGHYTYTFKGRFSMGGRTIEVEGSRSSRDPFFKQYDYIGTGQSKQKVERAVHERDNKRDVKMAALTNLLGNGITRILGIRNLSWEDLERFANIKKGDIGKVTYGGPTPKEQLKEPQQKQQQDAGQAGTITEPQRKRFYAIAKGSGKSDEDISDYLSSLGINHSGDIPKDRYDEACEWAATTKGERQPGQDG